MSFPHSTMLDLDLCLGQHLQSMLESIGLKVCRSKITFDLGARDGVDILTM
jgi:hypothetical protein